MSSTSSCMDKHFLFFRYQQQKIDFFFFRMSLTTNNKIGLKTENKIQSEVNRLVLIVLS